MPLITVVSDRKAGHLNQSLGLAEALQRGRADIDVSVIDILPIASTLPRLLWPQHPEPGVDLLIGAGHATHMTLLACKRVAGCPAIVLMRPSLPRALFDLCIQPRHDGGRETRRIWLSDGPLNRMRPAPARHDGGVVLVGGPSSHFSWDADHLIDQLRYICDGSREWQLSGSRRTPADFLTRLAALALPGLTIHPLEQLPEGWLANTLASAAACWVTPDSASMVFEALTAGCAVGVLELPAARRSRVAAGVLALAAREQVTPYARFVAGTALRPPHEPFDEADRCARRILDLGWL